MIRIYIAHLLFQVTDVFLPTDRATGDPKGFAFVTFDNSEVPQALCNEGKIVVNGKEVNISVKEKGCGTPYFHVA